MFGMFKSKATREREAEVDRIGKDLFRQIALFRDKCRAGEFTSDVFKERANHAYTAGYMIGFIDEKLSSLFDLDADKSKYMTRIVTGIFPKTGVFFIKAKYEARALAENLRSPGYQPRVESYSDEFDKGIENGREELRQWEQDENYTPHLLSEFLTTGQLP